MNERIHHWLDTAPVLDLFQSHGLLYFLVLLVVVLLAKPLLGLVARYRLDEELTQKDNKAVAVSTAGYLFAVIIVTHGVLISGGEMAKTVWHDVVAAAAWALGSLVLLALSAWLNDKLLLRRFDNRKELVEDRNVGTGAVVAATYIGTAMIISASLSSPTGLGLGVDVIDMLVYFVIGQLAFIVFGALYQRFAGYDVHGEIEKDNVGAGIGFGMTLIAMAILVAGQIRRSDSLAAIAVWIVLSTIVLLACRWLVDLVILPKARFHEEIARDNNWGVALIEGAVAIGIAFLLNGSFS